MTAASERLERHSVLWPGRAVQFVCTPLSQYGALSVWSLVVLMVGCFAAPDWLGGPALSSAAPPIEVQQYRSGGLPPAESLALLKVSDDLQVDQLFAEPEVEQPVFINFDERGRMWVVQYRQYPHPAGLKILSHDVYWRNVYDRVPDPPPRHVSGRDRITIHSDTNGDGRYDRTQIFADGLNMVTAVERGRGGVWVLNPPYLLFYPDRDQDDIPDGDPQVVLSGFGLEDSHSLVNSLRWGPDGWLYAAQGSTVTANVVRPGLDTTPQFSQGQLIWRYHPELRIYEIFAEGGGNAFGLEMDAQGRIFSGHNGGDTRGFHYVQGGYFQKGFTKHGPLSNPYAFGFFAAMRHPAVERFTHTFLVYEAPELPERYRGKILGVEPLQGRVVLSERMQHGSSFTTSDIDRPVTSGDSWFRPVDIKAGPDGAVYVADWYDGQIAHFRSHEGQVDPDKGRIYRLSAREPARTGAAAQPASAADLSSLSSEQLISKLSDPNKWVRQTTLRIIGDRRDRSLIGPLNAILNGQTGQTALEALWGLNLSGGLTDGRQQELIEHDDPQVRLWTVRLACDDHQVSDDLARRLVELAKVEPNVEVRVQLACSAKRLPVAHGAPVALALARRTEDVGDIYQPLLVWWALESFCSRQPDETLSMIEQQGLWQEPLFRDHLASRLMRRFAQPGTRDDLLRCARLFQAAPEGEVAERLVEGFQQAFEGRAVVGLPLELAEELARQSRDDLVWQVRLGHAAALDQARRRIGDTATEVAQRIRLVQVLGETRAPGSVPTLLELLQSEAAPELLSAAIASLANFDDPTIPGQLLQRYPAWPNGLQQAVQSTLVARPTWAQLLIQSARESRIDPLTLSVQTLRTCLSLGDDQLAQQVRETWGDVAREDTAEGEAKVARLVAIVDAQLGDPYQGHKVFVQQCANCHRLFEEGGQVGPNLTSYNRTDLSRMLLSVVLPSAEIREGYENYVAILDDGRVVSGVLVQRDPSFVTIRAADGQLVTVERNTVESLQVQPQSLMPTGLLDKLDDEQLRNLFAYLRSTQPLNESQ